jgi:hypothetical protein
MRHSRRAIYVDINIYASVHIYDMGYNIYASVHIYDMYVAGVFLRVTLGVQ